MSTATPPSPSSSANPWNALWAMMIGFFMIMVDATIVAIANPTIMADLHIGYDSVIWVTRAYRLGYAGVVWWSAGWAGSGSSSSTSPSALPGWRWRCG